MQRGTALDLIVKRMHCLGKGSQCIDRVRIANLWEKLLDRRIKV
ncbi:MAG TPA: hypothetical protein VLJ11_16990 [Bryobacteraceae bacterium]|nr:hypothetical protein [Bryobacteraceae bacterium]